MRPDWANRAARGLLDPKDPHGAPITTPLDRRWLWHIEAYLTCAATNAILRQLASDLRAYLDETCDHHWLAEEAGGEIPARRQCLWCNDTEPETRGPGMTP